MGEMVMLAQRVEGIVCATTLEAQVRELRLIARHRPPYNRRSKFPDRLSWLKLTREAWPRLSVVKRILDDGADYIGPFGSRSSAEDALAALHDTFRIRQCTPKMAKRPRRHACALAELGHCLSPCDGSVEPETYAAEVFRVQRAMTADPVELVEAIRVRMADLAHNERFEDAARWRDRLTALLRAVVRTQRLAELTAVPELVAAAPHPDGWEIHVVRHGRLAAAGVMPRGTHPSGWVDALLATAESVEAGYGPVPAATAEETECLLRWLDTPGLRIVRGAWRTPLAGGARHLGHLELVRSASEPILHR
jgi:DNA polymerase-3 subunit epsilon